MTTARLTRYLVELERPERGWGDLRDSVASAKAAAAALRKSDVPVRFLRSIFVPEDDACFFLFEAPSTDAVEQAIRRAAIEAGSVSPALGAAGGTGRRPARRSRGVRS
jgi:hypothetical protein